MKIPTLYLGKFKQYDKVFITGKVFSDALGDPWIDVIDLYITEKAPEKDGANK